MLKFSLNPKLCFSLFLTLVGLSLPRLAYANQVIESQGDVTAKQAGSELFRPVTVGTSLHQGDILYPEADARVLVMCNNGLTWYVTPGIPASVNANCPSSSDIARVRSGFVNIIGKQDKNIPYLLSPRYTHVQDSNPTFRWNAVAGTQQYTVKLLGGDGFVHWSTTTDATTITYPQDAPPFVANINYLLIVETDSGASSLQDAGGILGFSILPSSDIQKMQQEIEKALTQPNLSAATQTLIKAKIYENYGLFQDGIDILSQELQKNQNLDPNQKALIYTLLGQLYNEVGLTRLAEPYFRQAVDLFQGLNNDLGRAEALVGLAIAQWLNEQVEQAQKNEKMAMDIYQAKGDLERLEQWEDDLKAARNHKPSPLPDQIIPVTNDNAFDLGLGIRVP